MNNDADAKVTVSVTINEQHFALEIPSRMTVADMLRDTLGLTGTHIGCEQGVCGSCTILLDGQSARSCILYVGQVDQRRITTVEGLADSCGRLHPVQQAFRQAYGLQCGFCTPGFLIAVVELLGEVKNPTEQAIREALSGNICRCTGYDSIVDAVQIAAATWEHS